MIVVAKNYLCCNCSSVGCLKCVQLHAVHVQCVKSVQKSLLICRVVVAVSSIVEKAL